MSQREAGRALATASAMLDNLETRSAAHRALPGLTATVKFTEPCATSGSFSVDGSYEASDDGLHSALDAKVGFAAGTIGSDAAPAP